MLRVGSFAAAPLQGLCSRSSSKQRLWAWSGLREISTIPVALASFNEGESHSDEEDTGSRAIFVGDRPNTRQTGVVCDVACSELKRFYAARHFLRVVGFRYPILSVC